MVAMNDMDNVFKTVLSGVTVYITGQVILKIFLDPIVKLKESIGSVNCTIVKFAHIIHNSKAGQHDQFDVVFSELRLQSGELYAKYSAIPFYKFTRLMFGLPSQKNLFEAARNLIALSNWMGQDNDNKVGFILRNVHDLYSNLNLTIPPEDKVDSALINKLIQSYISRA